MKLVTKVFSANLKPYTNKVYRISLNLYRLGKVRIIWIVAQCNPAYYAYMVRSSKGRKSDFLSENSSSILLPGTTFLMENEVW